MDTKNALTGLQRLVGEAIGYSVATPKLGNAIVIG
jgi:hypothetical protein